jgi:APA family basic amino acid/polyamine antiporter
MFVAFTGYGRIATMGEEVVNPRRTIPRAILWTLAVSAVLYFLVAHAAMRQVGGFGFGKLAAGGRPLGEIALNRDLPWLAQFLAVGAVAAMLGVLLNLILGLSRVLLAMGRRKDVPHVFSQVDKSGTTPAPAVIGVACIILVLVAIGDIKVAWSISAFTVLIYYGITNLCCLRLPDEHRLYPRAFAYLGLAACFFLAFWIEREFWLAGLGLIAAGLVWHLAARKLSAPSRENA